MNITNFLFSAYSPEKVILCIYRLQKPYISYLLIWARHIPIHFSEKDLHPNMHPFESSFLVDDIMAKTLCNMTENFSLKALVGLSDVISYN